MSCGGDEDTVRLAQKKEANNAACRHSRTRKRKRDKEMNVHTLELARKLQRLLEETQQTKRLCQGHMTMQEEQHAYTIAQLTSELQQYGDAGEHIRRGEEGQRENRQGKHNKPDHHHQPLPRFGGPEYQLSISAASYR